MHSDVAILFDTYPQIQQNKYMFVLRKIYYFLLNTIQTLLIIATIFMLLYAVVIQPNQVSGSSMYPTFKDKEYLLSYLLDVRMNKYVNGDVVVFHSPVDIEKLYIKRVIGMEGDRIKIEGGKVYVNGELLDESAYLSSDSMTFGGGFLGDGDEKEVPAGYIFVMGDNRPYSSDSREWGFLDRSRVIGRSIVRILPLNQFHIIRNPYTKDRT